jgi:hypothetical protein
MMPFRNMTTLESWLDEFRSKGYPLVGSVRVMGQDGEDGANTGLVGVALTQADVAVYIQPETLESTRWLVTFEAREAQLDLDSAAVLRLSSELATVSALCAFLEGKSAAYVGTDVA